MRVRNYFEGIQLSPSEIYVGTTGAKINVDRNFFKSLIAVVKIFSAVKLLQFKRLWRGKGPVATIAFYPQTPGPWFNIWQVARLGDLKTISFPSKADILFAFEDSTHTTFDKSYLQSLAVPVLNLDCNDISKEHVADIFEDVFGYSLRIDPLSYEGLAVQKSDANGTHDGIIIDCPIPASKIVKSQSYQRLVDSTFSEETSEDLRVAYVLETLALVYHKHKPLTDRFGMHYLSVDVRAPEDVFSKEEISLIEKFCHKMQLDFGALDVMRDKQDGRIYIVDVNKTCMPVLSLSLKTQIQSQQKIADALNSGLRAMK